ncbi:hypothetical protein V7x_08670 [Crateriforma conspicua]|uniref:Uncharacterized protein n=1 Tax=Crateriforma conspicua TaxID=2527996 RepID=A0A5C5Y8H7_9PLAN|nr:hypothetical protein Pan14r_30490 [Crateriforma conspicua]TWU65321.1 hypothetical protein V7x_08670 [Crateriforma conspicua]
MKCPQCETPLRLVAATEVNNQPPRATVLRRFRIIDLLAVTALVALHLASLPAEVSKGGSEIAALLYLSPTAITCLIHLRLRLNISAAIFVHYVLTIAWTFLHAVGLHYATNAYNPMMRSGQRVEMAVYSNAWNDTLEMAGWAIAFAATYGVVCYTAVSAAINYGPCPAGAGTDNSG